MSSQIKMCVLVAEDEPSISELICELLDAYDVPVIAVGSADEAARYFEQYADQILLLITDVRMPGRLDGYDLAEIVRARKPVLPIIVTSGYDGEPQAGRVTGISFLAKPWVPAQFDSAIRQLL